MGRGEIQLIEAVSMDATNEEGMNLQLSTSSVAGSAGAATNFQEESGIHSHLQPNKILICLPPQYPS